MFKNKDTKNILIISLIYFLIFLFMLPLRNFAFDDDFAYIQTAQNFIIHHQFKISEWSAVATVFPTFWATLFSNVFGFSIKTLHFSNIVIVYFGLVSFYLLLREFKVKYEHSLFYTLCLLFFPWFLQYTYSFLSDTIYLSLLVMSLLFFTKAFNGKKAVFNLIVGSFIAGLGFLTRQIAIAIPAGAATALIYRAIANKNKEQLVKLIFALLPSLLLFLPYQLWIIKYGMTAAQFAYVYEPARRFIEENVLHFFDPYRLGGINRNLIETLVQRSLGYLYLLSAFLFPSVFVFNLSLGKIKSFFAKNKIGILLTYLFFIAIFLINYFSGEKFTKDYPKNLLVYSNLVDWNISWKYVVSLGLPLFPIFFYLSIRAYKNLFLNKRNISRKASFISMSIIIIAFLLFFIYGVYINNIYSFPQIYITSNIKSFFFFVSNLLDYIPFLFKNYSFITIFLKDTWFYFTFLTMTSILLVWFFVTKRINFKNQNTLTIFYFFVFFIQFILVIFFAYFFWYNYILQFMPFAIIWLALITNKLSISKVRSFVFLVLISIISLQIVSTRYQRFGAEWETAERLVGRGISPVRISVNQWAWRPYWYFDEYFQKAVKKAGNKYDYTRYRIGNWPIDYPKGDNYELVEVPYNIKREDFKNGQVVLESSSFREFLYFKRIFVIRKSY